ncbi:DNA packaging protein [Psittacid alphaherpesvirus 5]|nr:DNA packaging protein [Psittacid alphaherpesvirus 5]
MENGPGELDLIRKKVRKLNDIIPDEELNLYSLETLFDLYINKNTIEYEVWFYDSIPIEIEALLPTTAAKLNYLSYTAKLAAEVKYGTYETGVEGNAHHKRDCVHTRLIANRRERFIRIVNKFLDLHQILCGIN